MCIYIYNTFLRSSHLFMVWRIFAFFFFWQLLLNFSKTWSALKISLFFITFTSLHEKKKKNTFSSSQQQNTVMIVYKPCVCQLANKISLQSLNLNFYKFPDAIFFFRCSNIAWNILFYLVSWPNKNKNKIYAIIRKINILLLLQ